MNSNDIRAAAIGVTGGVVATFATIAFLDRDLETRIPEAINRWRLPAEQRAEYDRIRQEQAARRDADAREREQVQVEIRANFRPDLLSGPAMPLSELSIPGLISEIRYAKNSKCAEMEAADRTYPVVSDARVWAPQLEALRSEFQSRHIENMSLLDRTRYNAAYSYVISHADEWPDTPVRPSLPVVKLPTASEGESPSMYPPYPDFSGPYSTANNATEE
ncbi:hypothetical protein [Nocardia tengchongensis]|uniref:hypothetical protein n=1 Tax=Nocardia tengchongensis TaxID=2055889 RepID=UPI0036B7200E